MTYKKINPYYFIFCSTILIAGVLLIIGVYGLFAYANSYGQMHMIPPSIDKTEYAWTTWPFSIGAILPIIPVTWHFFGRPELYNECLTQREQEVYQFEMEQFWKEKRLEHTSKDSDWDVL